MSSLVTPRLSHRVRSRLSLVELERRDQPAVFGPAAFSTVTSSPPATQAADTGPSAIVAPVTPGSQPTTGQVADTTDFNSTAPAVAPIPTNGIPTASDSTTVVSQPAILAVPLADPAFGAPVADSPAVSTTLASTARFGLDRVSDANTTSLQSQLSNLFPPTLPDSVAAAIPAAALANPSALGPAASGTPFYKSATTGTPPTPSRPAPARVRDSMIVVQAEPFDHDSTLGVNVEAAPARDFVRYEIPEPRKEVSAPPQNDVMSTLEVTSALAASTASKGTRPWMASAAALMSGSYLASRRTQRPASEASH